MWDVGTFQTEKEDQCSSKCLLYNKQRFAKKDCKCKSESHNKNENIRVVWLSKKNNVNFV